jgi:transposase
MSRDIVDTSKWEVAMSLGRYVVEAIVSEGRSPTEVARQHRISRSWIYELLARHRQGWFRGFRTPLQKTAVLLPPGGR